jgi:hypothetical protein
MAHSHRPGSLMAERAALDLPDPARSASRTVSGPEGLTLLRAELREILGVGTGAAEPFDDAAQVRRAFLRAELARLDTA